VFPGPNTSASTFLASLLNSRSETARVRVGLKSLINLEPSPMCQSTLGKDSQRLTVNMNS
jgi:hypothetical protein